MKFIYICIVALLLPIFSYSQIGTLPPFGACVDASPPGTWYWQDVDRDGFGGTRGDCLPGPRAGYTKTGGDCNDNNAALYPKRWYKDNDGDGKGNPNIWKWSCSSLSGYVTNGDDCNDSDSTAHTVRKWYRDADGDGHGVFHDTKTTCVRPSGYVQMPGDCNDNNANIHPRIYEGCSTDGLDNDCDGEIDENIPSMPSASISNLCGKTIISQGGHDQTEAWFWQSSPTGTSRSNYAQTITLTTGNRIYLRAVTNGPGCWGPAKRVNYSITPIPKWYKDSDGDGFASTTQLKCTSPGTGYTRTVLPVTDCNDASASLNPNTVWYRDADGDSWGNKSVTKKQCTKPSGYVRNDDDYNDGTNLITNIAPKNFYRDADGDTFGNPNNKTYRSVKPGGYVTNAADCNDGDASLTPFTTWYRDADGDSWGNKSVTKKQCTKPSGYVRNDDDYNDSSNIITNIPPKNFFRDADGDTFGNLGNKTYRSVKPNGYVTNGIDCNDGDASIHPNTIWYRDADGDSWGNKNVTKKQCTQPSGYVRNDDDYNDAIPFITNIAPKNFYKDADGDTFGNPSNKVYRSVKPSGYVTNAADCNDGDASLTPNTTWYADTDGDSWGNKSVTKKQCAKPSGYVRNDDDYNDSSPIITNIAPKNFYRDADGDTFGNPNNKTYRSIKPSGYVTNSSDYDDNSNIITNIAPKNFYRDADGDTFGNPNNKTYRSVKPSGYVTNSSDYDDNSNIITNIAPKNFYRDADVDTYGNPSNKTYRSVQPDGFVTNSSDYDDTTANITNIAPKNFYGDADNDGFGDVNQNVYYSVQPDGYVTNADDECPDISGPFRGCIERPYKTVSRSDENYIFTRVYQEAMKDSTELKFNKDVIESITYFDGLGRSKQQVAIKASPTGKDIITHIEYDVYGRQAKQYLPFERQGDPLGSYKVVDVVNDINSYYKTTYGDDFTVAKEHEDFNAYSQSIYEASPLNRVLEQGAPGTDWKADPNSDADHTIKFDWGANGINEVVYFKVNFTDPANTEFPTLVKDEFYAPDELYVTITKDENWKVEDGNNHTTKEYKNKLGQVVLKRTYNTPVNTSGGSSAAGGGEAHDTYYVYDDFGNLTFVLPPKVDPTNGISDTELTELCYQYRYDDRNRLIEKKIPGKGDANTWESIVYNKLDQPILTQDPNQKTKGEWLFTKYDVFGRVAYTGKVTDNRDRKTIQEEATVYADDLWVERGGNVRIGEVDMHYTDGGYPKVTMGEVLAINYYDDYGFLGTTPDVIFVKPETVFDEPISDKTKSLATGSKVKVLGTSYWTTKVSYYDKKARPIYVAGKNEYLNNIDIVESKLDFAGKVEKTKTTHTKGNNAAIVTVDTFEYDHMGRVLKQTQKINTQAEELIVVNSYDALGQLASKKVGDGLQDVNYTYNVRGWLKAINNGTTVGGDLFGFALDYNAGTNPLYNGNISKTSWQTANDNVTRSYAYTYDALNRITSGISNDGKYNLSSVTYDKMGNIMSLQRKGGIVANIDYTQPEHFGMMDNLDYDYDEGNKLTNVTELPGGNAAFGFKDGNVSGNDYTYDANGNMTIDRNKGITGITYNHLNLPETVSISNTEGTGNITYIYDATGTKLKKIVTEGSSLTTEYAGNYVYKNGNLEFFNHPEGIVEKEADGYKYVYQFKDHLGNVRLSYKDADKNGSISQSEIIQEKNYYPFGLTHKGYNDDTRGRNHTYGFGGKEEQNGLGLDWMDFGFRNYDPAIGRWMNIDPMADNYLPVSPYNYVLNNPNLFIDPDGRDVYIYYVGPRRRWYNKPFYYAGGHTALGAKPSGYSNVTYANVSGSATRTYSTDSYRNEYGFSRYINESKTIMDYVKSGDVVIRMRIQLPKKVEEIIASYIANESGNAKDQGGLFCTARCRNILLTALEDAGYSEDEAEDLVDKLLWYNTPEFPTADEMIDAGFVGADYYFNGGENKDTFTHINFDFKREAKSKEESKKKRKGFDKLLSNFNNLSEGTYTWNGNNWIKK